MTMVANGPGPNKGPNPLKPKTSLPPTKWKNPPQPPNVQNMPKPQLRQEQPPSPEEAAAKLTLWCQRLELAGFSVEPVITDNPRKEDHLLVLKMNKRWSVQIDAYSFDAVAVVIDRSTAVRSKRDMIDVPDSRKIGGQLRFLMHQGILKPE